MSLIIRESFTFKEKLQLLDFYVEIICTLYKIHISRGAKALIPYYIELGINEEAHRKFVEDKKVLNKRSAWNCKAELKKYDVIFKKNHYSPIELDEKFNIKVEDKIGFQLLLKTQ